MFFFYVPESNVYLANIAEALAAHTPCNATTCQCNAAQINRDLEPFRHGITRADIQSVRDRGTFYKIWNNRLFRSANCMFPARCQGIEHFLLANLKALPNADMVINTRDWPQIDENGRQRRGPVFSFSKTAQYLDIMYPAWSFWTGGPAISLYPTGLGRWDQHRRQIPSAAVKWASKTAKAFFRGSRTSSERDSIVLLSRSTPDLVDAQYTKNQAWKSAADTLNAAPAAEVPLVDHCRYKYLFNFRGVAASFRFKHLFLCRSLVFHVADEWQEFFYGSLKPWVHYVPVAANPTETDLKSLLAFFREHDDVAQAIADRGFEHIWQTLTMNHVHCYWTRLLKKYAKKLRYDVSRDDDDDDLIEIK